MGRFIYELVAMDSNGCYCVVSISHTAFMGRMQNFNVVLVINEIVVAGSIVAYKVDL